MLGIVTAIEFDLVHQPRLYAARCGSTGTTRRPSSSAGHAGHLGQLEERDRGGGQLGQVLRPVQTPLLANRLTLSVALANAKHGVRCNAILPGLMDTPMAINTVSDVTGVDPEALRAKRHAMVPLNAHMGDAWDTAHAALFLASDEAKFITGVLLPVDGGASARIG